MLLGILKLKTYKELRRERRLICPDICTKLVTTLYFAQQLTILLFWMQNYKFIRP